MVTQGPSSGYLAPPGAVAALICHYAGMNTTVPVGTLTGSVPVPDPAGLATALNASRPAPSGPVSCPMDDGSINVVLLAGPGGTVTTVRRPSGCGFLTSTGTAGHYVWSTPASTILEPLLLVDPSCSWLYTFWVRARNYNVGCGGTLTPHGAKAVTVHVGDRITMDTGSGVPIPEPRDPSVVTIRLRQDMPKNPQTIYAALAAGTTALQVTSTSCTTQPATSPPLSTGPKHTCPVLTVTVQP